MMMQLSSTVNLLLLSVVCLLSNVPNAGGHGVLMKPAGRVSAWRWGFKTPINYNDMEMWCGGLGAKRANNGKCGVCGDRWDGTRTSEVPNGQYVTKPPTITGQYLQGEWIDVTVNLTAAHKGFFRFRVCPALSDEVEVTQECLDQNTLVLDGHANKTFQLGDQGPGIYRFLVQLPADLVCQRCLLQWDYTCGNQGKSYLDNETFRGCADITIAENPNRISSEDDMDE